MEPKYVLMKMHAFNKSKYLVSTIKNTVIWHIFTHKSEKTFSVLIEIEL